MNMQKNSWMGGAAVGRLNRFHLTENWRISGNMLLIKSIILPIP
jgi:hypothetical protein